MSTRTCLKPDRHCCQAGKVIRHLDTIVTRGPGDLDIAYAMSAGGYDAAKWAEGQGILAELVSVDSPGCPALVAADTWYMDAVATARRLLAAQPDLLAKLGLAEVLSS